MQATPIGPNAGKIFIPFGTATVRIDKPRGELPGESWIRQMQSERNFTDGARGQRMGKSLSPHLLPGEDPAYGNGFRASQMRHR